MDDKDTILAVLLSGFFGSTTASLVAIKKKVTIGQTLLAAGFGCLVSSSLPFGLMAFGVHWGAAIPLSVAAGLLIYGILAWAEAKEKTLPSTDLSAILPKLIFPNKDKQQKPPDGDKP